MNLKYYLRGLGLGIVLTAVLLAITSKDKEGGLSEDEIILRAKSLGMIEESELPEYIEEAREHAEAELRADIEEEVRESLREEIRSEADSEMSAQQQGVSGEQGVQEVFGAEAGTEGDALSGVRDESDGEHPLEAGVKGDEEDSGSAGVSGEAGMLDDADGTRESAAGVSDTAGAAGISGIADTSGVSGVHVTSGASGSTEREGTENASAVSGDAERTDGEGEGQETDRVEFIINKGEMARDISRKLEGAGLVESASDFESFLLRNGYDRFIKASRYMIPVGADEEQIANIITNYGKE